MGWGEGVEFTTARGQRSNTHCTATLQLLGADGIVQFRNTASAGATTWQRRRLVKATLSSAGMLHRRPGIRRRQRHAEERGRGARHDGEARRGRQRCRDRLDVVGVAAAQETDDELGPIYRLLQWQHSDRSSSDEPPDTGACGAYLGQCERLKLRDGVLYRSGWASTERQTGGNYFRLGRIGSNSHGSHMYA
jgi:hypothetical protein